MTKYTIILMVCVCVSMFVALYLENTFRVHHHSLPDLFVNILFAFSLSKILLDLSSNNDDVYYKHFLDHLYGQRNITRKVCQRKQYANMIRLLVLGDTVGESGPQHYLKLVARCECVRCVPIQMWVVSSLNYITNRLVYSELKLDLLTMDSWRITGENISLFIMMDKMEKSTPVINIIFHDCTRILVKGQENCYKLHNLFDVDIVTKRYSVVFRTDSVDFSSLANLLTYSLDTSGCKTKICNLRNIDQVDFVTKQFNYELKKIQTESTSDAGGRMWGEELARNGLLKMNSSQWDTEWTVDGKCVAGLLALSTPNPNQGIFMRCHKEANNK